MKKIFNVIITILLLVFSFYYTNIAVNLIKDNDDIMKSIKSGKADLEVKPVNAIVEYDTLIPGVSGVKVNLDDSYSKMANYGNFNKSLYVFEKERPSISVFDYYNKYIYKGRKKRSVSLVFTVTNINEINDILNIINNSNTLVTIFIDGKILDTNIDDIKNIISFGHEVEVLNYDSLYDSIYFKNSIQILEELKKEKSLYCYCDYKNKKLLNLCSKLKLHTVIPSIKIKNNSYMEVKDNLDDGLIIKMPNSGKYLNTTIKYIKQRGFKIERLDNLLKE